MRSTSSFLRSRQVSITVIGMLRQAVMNRVVVSGIGDEDVLYGIETCWIVQRAGHDADVPAMLRTPEQAGATQVTEAAFCFGR